MEAKTKELKVSSNERVIFPKSVATLIYEQAYRDGVGQFPYPYTLEFTESDVWEQISYILKTPVEDVKHNASFDAPYNPSALLAKSCELAAVTAFKSGDFHQTSTYKVRKYLKQLDAFGEDRKCSPEAAVIFFRADEEQHVLQFLERNGNIPGGSVCPFADRCPLIGDCPVSTPEKVSERSRNINHTYSCACARSYIVTDFKDGKKKPL